MPQETAVSVLEERQRGMASLITVIVIQVIQSRTKAGGGWGGGGGGRDSDQHT